MDNCWQPVLGRWDGSTLPGLGRFWYYSGQKKRLMEVIELELELAESQLASRMSRKKEYKAKVIEITQANERKWLLKQGKGDCLDFKDE